MKIIFTFCFVLICFSFFAQQHPTSNTQCQIAVNEILLMQSFNIDDPISEDAQHIFLKMYEKLNLIYENKSNDQKLAKYITDFNKTLLTAKNMNLNISMFQEDIDFVSKLTQ
ncbi:MAG TPA: hypothetical protein VFD77_00125 [Brumimicrobium sp.]|nr:hypothetical protein [Brumimicrobium sp.]